MKYVGCLALFLFLVSPFTQALTTQAYPQGTEFRIGIEQIDFYPHYDFADGRQRGYIFDLMGLFGKLKGYQIKFVPLPVKRLYAEADEGDIVDLAYPDNPKWQSYQNGAPKIFSEPVVYTLGSTIVTASNAQISVNQVKSLANIHGFTPTLWLEIAKTRNIRFVDVADTDSALGLVLKGRVDAASIELNVTNAWLVKQGVPNALVAGEQLPFTQLPFLLSTRTHPAFITEFNQFLVEQAAQVAALKKRYKLVENRPSP